jgi:hypothetical protein
MLFGKTFDNGDYYDMWCDNYEKVPPKMMETAIAAAYEDCWRTQKSSLILTDYAEVILTFENFPVDYFMCRL